MVNFKDKGHELIDGLYYELYLFRKLENLYRSFYPPNSS